MPFHPDSAGQHGKSLTGGLEVSMTCVTGRQTRGAVDTRVSPAVALFIAVIFLGVILVYGPAAPACAVALVPPLGITARCFYLRVRAARLR